ncbi:nucleotidyltransferase family protein [Myxococcota bacterium]|nr:nucleotidyltransferase family protein [Myxococcota bacterium]
MRGERILSHEGPDKAAVELVEALEGAGISCAIGGALALGFWAGPRGTIDVDLNVFVEEAEYERLLDILLEAGCSFHREKCLQDAEQGNAMILQKDGWPIDLFVPSIPFYSEAQRTVRRVRLREKDVPVLGPEALCVFKLLFFRRKDIVDLERLVALQGHKLDRAYIRGWIVDMLGEEDPRVGEWDRILRVHGPL